MLSIVENPYSAPYVELATTHTAGRNLHPGTDVIPILAICEAPNDRLHVIIAYRQGHLFIAH